MRSILKSSILAFCVVLTNAAPTEAIFSTDKHAVTYDTVFYDEKDIACGGTGGGGGSTNLVGSDNVEKAYNFFIDSQKGDKKLAPHQSAGIIGNLIQESGVDPTIVQPNGVGHGIAQWSKNERWQDLIKFANGRDPKSLDVQLDFLWHEMNNVPPWNQSYPAVKNAANIEDATRAFMDKFEKPAAAHANLPNRIRQAELVLKRFGNGAPASIGTADPAGAAVPGCGSDSGGPGGSDGAGKPGENTSSMKCPAGSDAGIGTVHVGQTGKTYQIRLCNVQNVIVNASIAKEINDMLNASKGAGLRYSGYGYRTYERQQELRRSNGCPNVFTAPSSSCRVPTARPGFSNHEDGLAVDWSEGGSLIRSRGTRGFQWLNQNAGKYGFKNFPKEAWHWSVDGN